MFKDITIGYTYHTTSFSIVLTESAQLPVVLVESWSNPLTVRLYKAAKPHKSKDAGRVVIN